jgi:hypothetical protein
LITLFTWFAAVTPSPSPSPVLNEDLVTPGIVGFVATFFIAIATVLLVIDMTRRIRRVRYRAEVQEQLDAEEAAAGGVAPAKPAPTKPAPTKPAPTKPAPAKPAPED